MDPANNAKIPATTAATTAGHFWPAIQAQTAPANPATPKTAAMKNTAEQNAIQPQSRFGLAPSAQESHVETTDQAPGPA